jgi:1,4-dihydroxy-2-naphthoate octaprenyltransferase
MEDFSHAKDFLKSEFEAAKREQVQRIAFRDNMLFVQLGANGAIASWVLARTSDEIALFGFLVIPWLCTVLGWTYLVNDHMISRIGKYVRKIMNCRISEICKLPIVESIEDDKVQFTIDVVFGWEPYHRIDMRRIWRKRIQFFVDELTFVFPGILAVVAYAYLSHQHISCLIMTLMGLECIALVILGIMIGTYADWGRDTDTQLNKNTPAGS